MSKQNRNKLLIDLIVFIAFLISMDPRSSGIVFHEWLTIAIAGVVIVHLLLNWNWIVEMTKRLFVKSTNGMRLNYALNWTLFRTALSPIPRLSLLRYRRVRTESRS